MVGVPPPRDNDPEEEEGSKQEEAALNVGRQDGIAIVLGHYCRQSWSQVGHPSGCGQTELL